MTYSEAIEYLLDLTLFGSKLGLDKPRRLAALAGSPHGRLRFIHVAGTNGKGSVCAMLESIYREAGLRTGLFTSPHLVSFRERMLVDRELIPEETLARLTSRLRNLAADFPEGQGPTFFDMGVTRDRDGASFVHAPSHDHNLFQGWTVVPMMSNPWIDYQHHISRSSNTTCSK